MNQHLTFPPLAVVGSINVDITATATRLPRPGETIGAGTLNRQPGGKGANQAAAAARLGAATTMYGAVGDDNDGQWMLQALTQAGVNTQGVARCDRPTGTALIVVDKHGENQICVCPGANDVVSADYLQAGRDTTVLTQLEIPLDVVAQLADRTTGYLAINTAPAHALPHTVIERADLFIANESEYEQLPELADAALVAVTYGAQGAALIRRGQVIARCEALPATVVNTIGAGDAFCAAITLALTAGFTPDDALRTACAVGSAAVRDAASQPQFGHLHTYAPTSR